MKILGLALTLTSPYKIDTMSGLALKRLCKPGRGNSSDQNLFSRHNNNNLSNTQVMRIKITINSTILSHFKNNEKALKFRPEKSCSFFHIAKILNQ